MTLVAAIFAMLALVPAQTAVPQHIVSLNVCTDDLLLDLVPAERIASVTDLSRSPSFSYLWRQAARVPVNYGGAEEVFAEKPDLVLAGSYTTAMTRALVKQAGIPMLEVAPASTFAEIRTLTRRVAKALGESGRGEVLIKKMDATLDALERTEPKRTIRVAGWEGGSVPGKGSLFDAIVTAAGGKNIASAEDGDRSNSFGIEQLLVTRPDVLLYGAADASTPSLRTDSDQHPVLMRLYAHRRISYPQALYGCGVPESAGAAQALRNALLEAMKFSSP